MYSSIICTHYCDLFVRLRPLTRWPRALWASRVCIIQLRQRLCLVCWTLLSALHEEKEREEPLGLVNVHNSCTGTKVNWSSHINTHSCRFGGGDLLDEGDSVLYRFTDLYSTTLFSLRTFSGWDCGESIWFHQIKCTVLSATVYVYMLKTHFYFHWILFVWNQKVTSLHLRETCQDTHKSAINILKQWNNICMWITDFI